MVFTVVALVITAINVLWHSTFSPEVSDGLLWLAIFNQVVASFFAVLGIIKFRGTRLRPNYKIGKPPIWTLGWTITFLALIAALGAILLPAARFIGW